MLQMRTQDTLCALRRIAIIFPPFDAKCEILNWLTDALNLQAQGFRKGANGVRKVSYILLMHFALTPTIQLFILAEDVVSF